MAFDLKGMKHFSSAIILILLTTHMFAQTKNQKAEGGNPKHVGAPLQGMLSKIFVKKGQLVKKNEPLFVIEAMKMETTVTASNDVEVKNVSLKEGVRVYADDLIVILN